MKEPMSDDRVRPFSQGTQYLDWNNANCCRCAKYHVERGEVVEPICPLEEALMEACVMDGTVDREIADRLGVPENTWSGWSCKEREAERPEGVVRHVPAAGQLTLF